MTEDKDKRYTKEEERINAISHAVGIVGGIIVGVLFLIKGREVGLDGWGIASIWLYIFGMLASYAFSTAYHACSPASKWKRRLRKLDHSAIYWPLLSACSLRAIWWFANRCRCFCRWPPCRAVWCSQ